MNLLLVDTKLYHTRIDLWLTPKINLEPPEIIVSFDQDIVYQGPLTKSVCFSIDQEISAGEHDLTIEFTNKKDTDTNLVTGVDKAVVVDRIVLNDIQSPGFVWAGVYYPKYPEPWAAEQHQAGHALNPLLKSHNYLGWNGKWTLTFTAPVFTWIHNIENLGWIYS
jgi:hypothetical protein